jgi:hypothetical protein
MNKTSYLMFGVIAICIVLANMLGQRMAQAVLARSGKSYWPPVANSRLAEEYRSLYGADRTYGGYCLFNLTSVLGIVVWAFYMALKS